jgi:hypothetical protein
VDDDPWALLLLLLLLLWVRWLLHVCTTTTTTTCHLHSSTTRLQLGPRHQNTTRIPTYNVMLAVGRVTGVAYAQLLHLHRHHGSNHCKRWIKNHRKIPFKPSRSRKACAKNCWDEEATGATPPQRRSV